MQFKKALPVVFALTFMSLLLSLPTLAAPAQPAAGSRASYMPLIAKGKGSSTNPPTPVPATAVPPTAVPPTATPTRGGGFFALKDYLTYSAATAVDAGGGVHLAFFMSDEKHQDEPRNQPAYYVFCPGPVPSCADPANWGNLVQFSSQVNEVQIVVTPDGRPRLLVRRNGSAHNEFEYYACEADCGNGESWDGLYITNAAGADSNGFSLGQHYFALDAQNRPRFVYGNGWGNGKPNGLYYAFCDTADCTQPGSWETPKIMTGPEYKTLSGEAAGLAFDGDKPRVVIRTTISNIPTAVYYLECDAGCNQEANWDTTELGYFGNQLWGSWDLAIDAAGTRHVALYEPAGIDIYVGGKLYYGRCADNCGNPSAWQYTLVANGEGRNADIGIDPQGRVHMVYDGGQRGALIATWCAAGCGSAAQWRREVLETNQQLMQEFPVANPLTCTYKGQSWLDALPSLTFDQQGRRVVAYDLKNVGLCYYSKPTDPTVPVSKVERLWWAVRWAYFPKP